MAELRMDNYLQSNQHLWNEWTTLHEQSPAYKVQEFKAGASTLRPIERAELPDVAGKSLLHLQCHFGLDTLSWARAGAIVTGVDLSDQSIALARALSAELDIPATFICSDLFELPNVLAGQFDIVFTSYGVLNWLPDLQRWAAIVTHFLKPGGIFYIAEFHPFSRVFDSDSPDLKVANAYFFMEEPFRFEIQGSYAAGSSTLLQGYNWNHSLSEVFNALISAGLQIEFFHEFPFTLRERIAGMVQGEDGLWRLTQHHGMVPLLFSLQTRKAG
jgi:SAM-dependent methyltransferase